MNIITQVVLFLAFAFVAASQVFYTEDINIPSECEQIVTSGDHLLLEYTIRFANGSEGSSVKRPSQLFHIIVDPTVSYHM